MVSASLRAYLGFCAFRLLNVFLIQSQFDPDEYWQNLEPAYCHTFQPGEACKGLTWEWKRRPVSTDVESLSDWVTAGLEGPVRSYASILPTLIFYHIIQFLGLDSPWMVSRGPVLLNAVLVAAPTDWAVWYMARWMQSPSENTKNSLTWWCTYCSLTSWFNAYALIRTYSNSLETVLLAIALSLVSPVC
jgi:phosphatidylinositol glycan class B